MSAGKPRKCVTTTKDGISFSAVSLSIDILNPDLSTSISFILNPASSKELTVVGKVKAEATAVKGLFKALKLLLDCIIGSCKQER